MCKYLRCRVLKYAFIDLVLTIVSRWLVLGRRCVGLVYYCPTRCASIASSGCPHTGPAVPKACSRVLSSHTQFPCLPLSSISIWKPHKHRYMHGCQAWVEQRDHECIITLLPLASRHSSPVSVLSISRTRIKSEP
ncbi:hypothetical protein VTK26DRAFT_6871 [Humicola hyalothermophila]